MKVLIISDAWHPQVNGVVRTYEHLGEELEKQGHDVKVVGPADFPITIPMPGYAEIKLALAPYGRLKRIIANYVPDQIHIATEGPLGRAARKYCVKNKIIFSTAYHTHFPDYIAKRVGKYLPFLYDISHKLAVRSVRKFHAPSSCVMISTRSLKQELRSWGFTSPMERVVRGANLDRFYPATEEEEKTEFKDLKKPIALYVGRIAIEKNLEDFLQMDWEGSKVLVGDGPSRIELQKKYPKAIFTGAKQGEELAAHYRSADVFVFPSRTDTFGIVLIEALASGLPIAGYNVTGPIDIITKPYLGELHETDIAIAAKNALVNGTPQERANHVKTEYTWGNASKQFKRVLKCSKYKERLEKQQLCS